MGWRYDWTFKTGNAVHNSGDLAGTDEDVQIFYYDADGRQVGLYTYRGADGAFERGSYTNFSHPNSSHDLRNATQILIVLSNRGTHNPFWFPEWMAFSIDQDPTRIKHANLNEWIKPGERKLFSLRDAERRVVEVTGVLEEHK